MICRPHDTVSSQALYHGLYDYAEMRFLLAWLRPGDTFLDVGANAAPYSLLSTLVGDVRAIAFEPGAAAQERARANIALNHAGGAVRLEAVAVSDRDGQARLTAGRSATNALVGEGYDGAAETVPTVRLDSYARDHELARVGLVKVDVEGHEAQVLGGAHDLIARHRPALVLEANDVTALRRVADEHGYVLVDYDPDARTVIPRAWGGGPGGNLILVPDLAVAAERVRRPG
jgi:FkbM family methyltransferase